MSAVIPINAAENQDMHRVATFLECVFAGQQSGIIVLFAKPTKTSYFMHLDRAGWHREAATTAMQIGREHNAYFAVGVQGVLPNRGRGKEAGVVSLPGF